MKVKQEKKQKPSVAFAKYCISRKDCIGAECFPSCFCITKKTKFTNFKCIMRASCRDQYYDKNCELKRGKK